MSETLQVNGMVLSAMPIGENDKRVVRLTKELGKISAFARRARRPGSVLMAASVPFASGRFFLVAGRDSYVLVNASISRYFTELAQDPVGIWYGYYFLDFADYYGREGIRATDMLNLLYLSVKALLHRTLDNALVRRIFEIRLMVINGEYAPCMEGLSESALYTIQYVCTCPLEKLFTFTVSEDVLREISEVIDRHTDRILDRPLKSRKLLEEMAGG